MTSKMDSCAIVWLLETSVLFLYNKLIFFVFSEVDCFAEPFFFFFLQLLIFWKDFEMGEGSTTWHGNVFTPRQTGFFPIYYLVWVLPSFTPRRFLTLLTWTFHVCIKQVTLIKKTVIRWKVGLICIFMAQVVTFFFFFSHILFRRVHTRQSRKKYFVCVFLPKHHSLFWDLFFFSFKISLWSGALYINSMF